MAKGKRFVREDEVETQVFPWGRLAWLSEKRTTDTDDMEAGVVTLMPGKGHERHNHPGCEELLFVLDGEGDQTVEDGGEALRKRVVAGDLIHIPAGGFHSTINAGKTPMRIFVVYQVSGQVQGFTKLPGFSVEPPRVKADR
jgi:oxalate decarboxylase/phosphoglucose isomerase-like protein (cupin superfamily)